MFSSINGKTEGSWEQRTVSKSYNIHVKLSTAVNGSEGKLNLSNQYSDSEDEGNLTDDRYKLSKQNHNGTRRMLFTNYSETEDEELDYCEDNTSSQSTTHSFYRSKPWNWIKNTAKFLSVPIYWTLVQSLVFEKWILNRTSPSSINDSPVFIPANSFVGQTPRRLPIKEVFSQVGCAAKKQISWPIIFTLLLLGLLPLLYNFTDFGRMSNSIKDGIQGVEQAWKSKNVEPFSIDSTSKNIKDVNQGVDEQVWKSKNIIESFPIDSVSNNFMDENQGVDEQVWKSRNIEPFPIDSVSNNIKKGNQKVEQPMIHRNVEPLLPFDSDIKIRTKMPEILENFAGAWQPKIIVPEVAFSELEEKLNVKIEERMVRLEEVFNERLAAVVAESSLSASKLQQQPISEAILNEFKRDVFSYATDLVNKKECTVVCPSPPPSVMSIPACDRSGCDDMDMLVAAAINKYDADKTGKPDLALESAGGSIVSTRCTKKSDYVGSMLTIWNIPIWYPSNNPRKAIQPGTMPGDCWSFDGAEGYLVIKLVGPTRVTGFTLEHLSKAISPLGHIKSAPRRFQVVGLLDYNNPSAEFLFGEYEYLDNENPVQYFQVQNSAETFYPYVELKILSNHGSIEFTCLYRFRVHGYLESWTKLLS